ncbi:MAG: phosphate signaling complex protein PhoU [Alphaproteobacteria bacterium]|nr:phosphate signaling complex protein PhoU [Alphaproteobacteria bacterium]
MTGAHIVKSYDEQLERLTKTIVEMGGLAEAQIEAAIDALVRRDAEAAAAVIEGDKKIDQDEFEIDDLATKLLALRQPMGVDLRTIIGALKISSDIERVADYATNIAKRSIPLTQIAPVRPVHALPRMGKLALTLMRNAIDAFVEKDAQKAIAVWQADEELDEMYVSIFRELLTYMMEDPRSITACTHLLFIAKNLERIGDHVTNIAETIHFLVTGQRLRAARPKGARDYEIDLSMVSRKIDRKK